MEFQTCNSVMSRKAAILTFIVTLCVISNIGGIEGTKGLFVFGDSYSDTGEPNVSYPYGMTWPHVKHMGNRSSDGRNQVDYFAEVFDVPTPTPWTWMQLDPKTTNNGGVNFAIAGAGTNYNWGHPPLFAQVDAFEKFVKQGLWTKDHLQHSVALVSMGINDYFFYNEVGAPEGVPSVVANVVDAIALGSLRIQRLGINHIMVSTVVPATCMPYITFPINNSTACVKNETLSVQTDLHNKLLIERFKLLKKGLHKSNFIIVNLTKALKEVMLYGEKYGFVEALKQCCTGHCGWYDWEVCPDPSKKVIFDNIHPSQAGWKAIVNLYSSVPGYTYLGPMLKSRRKNTTCDVSMFDVHPHVHETHPIFAT